MAQAHPERSTTQRTPIELFDRMLTPGRRALDVLRVEVRTADGPRRHARAVGVYRRWRDGGLAVAPSPPSPA